MTIPSSVTSIGFAAFYGCSGLASVSFIGNAPTLLYLSVFGDPISRMTVYYFNDKMGFNLWDGISKVNMGDSTPTAVWLVTNGLSYNVDLAGDPDGDGVSLLTAYALNLDPCQNLRGSMPRPVVGGNSMAMRFYAGAAGVGYAVETSTNLMNWSTDGVTLSDPDADQIRTATVNRDAPGRFMRLVVTH